jgi:hypothetical protein
MYQSNTIVRLTRTLPGTCSASTLSGTYGLVIQGLATENSSNNSGNNGNGNGTGTGNNGNGNGTGNNDNNNPSTSGVQTPFFLLATVTFDGAGRVTPASELPSSPLSYLRYSGTYTVREDCTGTMTLSGMTPASSDGTGNGNGNGNGTGNGNVGGNNTTTTTQPMTFSFVLRRPLAEVNASGQAPGAGQAKPVLQITSSSANQSLIGEGYSTEQ